MQTDRNLVDILKSLSIPTCPNNIFRGIMTLATVYRADHINTQKHFDVENYKKKIFGNLSDYCHRLYRLQPVANSLNIFVNTLFLAASFTAFFLLILLHLLCPANALEGTKNRPGVRRQSLAELDNSILPNTGPRCSIHTVQGLKQTLLAYIIQRWLKV